MIFHTLPVLHLNVGDEVISIYDPAPNKHEIVEISTDGYRYKTSDGHCYNLYGFYSNPEFAEIIVRTTSTIKNLICNRIHRIIPI